jgi:hypothetical protein
MEVIASYSQRTEIIRYTYCTLRKWVCRSNTSTWFWYWERQQIGKMVALALSLKWGSICCGRELCMQRGWWFWKCIIISPRLMRRTSHRINVVDFHLPHSLLTLYLFSYNLSIYPVFSYVKDGKDTRSIASSVCAFGSLHLVLLVSLDGGILPILW